MKIYTELFRPKELKHIILPKRIRDVFEDGKEINQHYLFYSGTPGSGKTTLCHILAKDYDYLYINASDESSVETIRTKIKDYATKSSILSNGNYATKIIILDEIDGVSNQFFDALRGVVEQFANSVRFLATCNYINKVPNAIQSRFKCIQFEPINNEEEQEISNGYKKRLKGIYSKLGIEISDEVLTEFIKRNFPDMRKMLTTTQFFKDSGKSVIELEDVVNSTFIFSEIFNICVEAPNPVENFRKLSADYSTKTDDVLNALGNEFINWLIEKHPTQVSKIPFIIKEVAIHQTNRNFVIDPVVNMLSCVFIIQNLLNQK